MPFAFKYFFFIALFLLIWLIWKFLNFSRLFSNSWSMLTLDDNLLGFKFLRLFFLSYTDLLSLLLLMKSLLFNSSGPKFKDLLSITFEFFFFKILFLSVFSLLSLFSLSFPSNLAFWFSYASCFSFFFSSSAFLFTLGLLSKDFGSFLYSS